MLSIIIPTLNESKTGYLPRILAAYQSIPACEVICVDGGSRDDTLHIIRDANAKLVMTQLRSRAGRLNEGIKQAAHQMVLLNHPRSVVDPAGIKRLIERSKDVSWGAFTHKFDTCHPLLEFTSWYSNVIRGDLRKIYYLDHCIFAKKVLLEKVGLVPDVDIFEDTDLCLRLKKIAKAQRFSEISHTSAVRFVKNNMYQQAFMNQSLKWQYYLRQSHEKMNKKYEQGLELNSEYSRHTAKPEDKHK